MQRNFIAFKVRSKCSGSLFDVSSIWSFLFLFPKTESVKQKFTYSCLCGSNSCCTMYWSRFLRKSRKTLGFLFESRCCIVDTRPAADSRLVRRSWTKVRRGKKRETEGPVGFVWYQSERGWWATCEHGDQPRPDGQPHPRESITQWQWLTDTRSSVVAMLNG